MPFVIVGALLVAMKLVDLGSVATRAEKARTARQRQIDIVEGKRAAKRAKARDTVLGSRFDSELLATRFQGSRR